MVVAVVKLHYYLAPQDRLTRIVKPLLRLLHSSSEIASAALEDCALIVEQRPVCSPSFRFMLDVELIIPDPQPQDIFVDYLSSFFVKFSDPPESRRTRLRIIIALTNESNIRIVLKELLVRSVLLSSLKLN